MDADGRREDPRETGPCQESRSWQAALGAEVSALREELRAVRALLDRALAERTEAAPGPSGQKGDGRRLMCGFDPYWAAPGEDPG
ncbi:hypothetical protein [Streptomyces sp. SudanB182_2057]|uniref:hypothetical protein n=1 Tax=Streptomyces sp. SudanB182_2057 TaxID=3035281 RepID=UPI003F553A07